MGCPSLPCPFHCHLQVPHSSFASELEASWKLINNTPITIGWQMLALTIKVLKEYSVTS